jgi:hypothetical protein
MGVMAQVCNFSFLGGGSQEDPGSKPAQGWGRMEDGGGTVCETPISTNSWWYMPAILSYVKKHK